MGLFEKMKAGLSKTRANTFKEVDGAFEADEKITDELFERLEEVLIMADVGMDVSLQITDALKSRIKSKKIKYQREAKEEFKAILTELLTPDNEIKLSTAPSVILVIGVNGGGKTTSIGKLAYRFSKEGKEVTIAAGDTYRAAAAEQLEVWAKRANAHFIRHQDGSDPAAVIYDALASAKKRKADIVICDTAGRLHNKQNLMNELAKISKVIRSECAGLDLETLLVMDAGTGQNGISQAKLFKEAADITGVILTKLDGTAKGGIVIAIKSSLGLPVRYVGLGEGDDDLEPFSPELFVDGLFCDDNK